MLRSLLSLMLFVNVNTTPLVGPLDPVVFQETSLLKLSPIPIKKKEAISPVIKAKAALVMDVDTGIVLYKKNQHTSLPMASLTKIMTAVLILESHNPDEIVIVQKSYDNVPGVRIGLRKGERITVGSLLIGLLVRSGGDAALALAEYHSGSETVFVEAMNQKAKKLNLNHTEFKNSIGLDAMGHNASVHDLAMLTRHALNNQQFRSIVQMPTAEIYSADGDIRHFFYNTNQLLNSYLNIIGVKTGTTDAAGQSLINLAYNTDGHEIIAILLNSPNRFQENKGLIDWSFNNFYW
jgi:serine-type D-Ala-D-Ala carboxypeptidase (penicillin-binding protein 5/6)